MPVGFIAATGRGGRGGGVYFPDPVVSFDGADLAACRTARDTYFTGDDNLPRLQPYRTDQYLGILLKPTGANVVTETYLPGKEAEDYDNTQWVDRGSSTATDAVIDARVATFARANNPSGTIADARIPAAITRDAEAMAAYAALTGATFTGAVKGIAPVDDEDFVTKGSADAAYSGIESKEVHFAISLRYSTTDSVYEGSLFQDVAEIQTADLVFINILGDIPDNASNAVLRITLDGTPTDFILRGEGNNAITNNTLLPNTLYWGYRIPLGIRLIAPVGGESVVQKRTKTITNAELKALDTDYIDMIPSPGAGKFITVNSVIITKDGNDTQRPTHGRFGVWSSTSDTLVQAEADAYTEGVSASVRVPIWSNEDRYVYVIIDPTLRPLEGLSTDPNNDADEFFAGNFTEVMGGVTIGTRDFILYRSDDVYNNLSDINAQNEWYFMAGAVSTYVNSDPKFGSIAHDVHIGLVRIVDDSNAAPLFAESEIFGRLSGDREVIAITNRTMFDWFNDAGEVKQALAVGNQELVANSEYKIGAFIFGYRSNNNTYSSEAWDQFMQGVDDVTLDITVQYQVHSE